MCFVTKTLHTMGIGTTEKYDPDISQRWSPGLRVRRAGDVTTSATVYQTISQIPQINYF